MPALKLRLPKVDRPFYGDGKLATLAKARLADALATLDARPAPVPVSTSLPSDAVTVWISDAQQAAIDTLGRTHHLHGSGPLASGLLHAWACAERADAPDTVPPLPSGALTTLDRINAALGDGTRPDQARFHADLAAEVLASRPAHQVIFAEASTGVGKSRAFLAVVLDWCAQSPGEHAVIAAPSYNVLLQLIDQWHRIAAVHDVPPWEVIVGQQEFVSRHALERVLAEHPDTDGADLAQAWLAAGGRPADDDPFGHRWLIRSLRVATDHRFTLESDVHLDSDVGDDDPGMVAYRAQFAQAHKVPVIFCTHAMLAVEVRLRTSQANRAYVTQGDGQSASDTAWEAWQKLAEEDRRTSTSWETRNELLRAVICADDGRLPPIGFLLVDEAHLLEQSFAQVFASGASMSRLMRDLRQLHADAPKVVLAKDLKRMEDLWAALREVGAAVDGERVLASANAVVRETVEGVRTVLASITRRLRGATLTRPEARHLRAVQLALDVAARAAGERSGMSVRVSWSPNVQWPSIEVGRYDVSRELDFLWAVTAHRSALISATLYDDVSLAGLEGMRRTLSVRSSFVRPLVPVRPQWLFDPVTLHLVGDAVHADGLPRFRRPSQRDRLDPLALAEGLERWRTDVADYVRTCYATAAGGVLVLLTSHAEREEILVRIRSAIPADCLLTQSGGRSLDALRGAFLATVAEGRRPCLLAVGAAWTGLDLSGDGLASLIGRPVPASEDNVLTDLVIPTAPIGTNRSLTQEWRRERTGMIAEIGATSITFRQGIGRLVRREGIPHNRRLHFLDSRIHQSGWQALLQPVSRALSRYTRRVTV